MIRLFLKNYSDAECVALYNALSIVSHDIVQGTEPRKDLDSVLDYLTGYMDCREDKKKGGANQCLHV
jgi:hypothetical protein